MTGRPKRKSASGDVGMGGMDDRSSSAKKTKIPFVPKTKIPFVPAETPDFDAEFAEFRPEDEPEFIPPGEEGAEEGFLAAADDFFGGAMGPAEKPDLVVEERLAMALDNKPVEMDGSWVGGYHLSTNVNITSLYIQPDENGRIGNRIVCKDCFLPNWMWFDDKFWYGDFNEELNRTPVEMKVLQLVYDSKEKEGLVQLLSMTPLDIDTRHYRYLMPWYRYGDLSGVVNYYRRKFNKTEPEDPPPADPAWWLPEPFLWATFESLAKACLVFEQGALTRTLSSTWWEGIVHNDLKDSNIFLGDRVDNDKWKSYPEALMADFDRCFIIPRMNPDNPERWTGMVGTPNWIPPESDLIKNGRLPVTEAAFEISPKSNIWGIGAIMARLMQLRRPHYGVRDYDPDDLSKRQDWVEPFPGKYSRELVEAVIKCVKWDPAQRPLASQLVQYIEVCVDESGRNLGRGMRSGPALEFDPFKKPDEHFAVPFLLWESPKYAQGMVMPDM
ncbi:hypothetical protein MBLNU230_g5466t1 [Neophaeotheca triangularis]